MDFTNLARLTGREAPRLLLRPPTHLWNRRNVSSFLLFYVDARHPDSGPYVFTGSMSATKLFCHPRAQTSPTGRWGSEHVCYGARSSFRVRTLTFSHFAFGDLFLQTKEFHRHFLDASSAGVILSKMI